jgi:vitamin B12 transporter
VERGSSRREQACRSGILLFSNLESGSITSVPSGLRGSGLVAYSLKIIMTSFAARAAVKASKPLAIAIAVVAVHPCAAVAQTGQDKPLDTIVVTAARSPLAARDIITDTVVISPEEIAQSGETTLVDLLRRKRGIEITRTGGPGTTSSVLLRGTSNNQTVVLIDGVRSSSSTSGGATWAAIPLSQIDHVEIVYGPLSTLYGADAVGGVVQIFTKKGNGEPRLTASAGAGSDATRAMEAGISGATEGDHRITYALSAARETSDGFSATKSGLGSHNPDDDGYRKNSASGQFSMELAKGHELGFNFLYSDNSAQFDSGASTFDARNEGRLATYAVESKNRLHPNWASRFRLSRSIDENDSLTSTRTSTFNTRQDTLSWENDVTLGEDLLQLIVERREEQAESTEAAVARSRDTNSASAAYLLKRGKHLASVGIRQDHSSQFGGHTSGSIGYGYRLTPALRVTSSVGTSFRAPTFNELYFPRFGLASNQPEKGRSAELGFHYEAAGTRFSAIYFRNRLSNLIVNTNPCPVQQASYPFGCAYNVNKATLTGVSLEASSKFGDFTVRGSLDLQDPRDETNDTTLARRARQHGSVAIEHQAGRATSGAEVIFSGDRFDDAANRNRLGGYGLLNLYGSYELARNWSLFGRWDNVLDKEYELARNYATAGSSLFVGVRYGFR